MAGFPGPTIPANAVYLGIPDGYSRPVYPAHTALTFPLGALNGGTATPVRRIQLFNALPAEDGTNPLVYDETGPSGTDLVPSGNTWALPPTLPGGGWYWRALLADEDADPNYGPLIGDGFFITYTSDDGVFDEVPTLPSGPGGKDDLALLARCGLPFVRMTVRFDQDEATQHADNAATLALMNTLGWTGRRVLTFPDYKPSRVADVTRILNLSQYAGITHVIPTNEPKPTLNIDGEPDPEGGRLSPSFLPTQKSFFQAVRAASNPNRKVVLAPTVYAGPDWAPLLQQCIEGTIDVPEGIAPYYDELDWHSYPGPKGALAAFRTSSRGPGYYGAAIQVLETWDDEHGTSLAARPRLIDEGPLGGAFGANYGAGLVGQQAYSGVADLRLMAQVGVSQTDDYAVFSGRASGATDYPSWVSEGDPPERSNVFPVLALTLARAVQLHEPGAGPGVMRPWAAAIDFGRDDPVWIGNLYGGDDGTHVLDLQSIGRRDGAVTLQLSGTVPATLQIADQCGNPSTVTVTSGRAQVTVSLLGGYVHLPAGCTATVVEPTATFVNPAVLGVTADGPVGDSTPRSVIEGPRLDALLHDLDNNATIGALGVYRRQDSLPRPSGSGEQHTRFFFTSGVHVPSMLRAECVAPWQEQTALLRGEVRDAGGNALGEFDDTANLHVLPWASIALGWYVALWVPAHAFDVPLAHIPLGRVDLVTLQTTRGGSPIEDTVDGFGKTTLFAPDNSPATRATDGVKIFGSGHSGQERTMLQRVSIAATPVRAPVTGFLVRAV